MSTHFSIYTICLLLLGLHSGLSFFVNPKNVSILTHVTPRLKCYTCDLQPTPDSCLNVTECGVDQECLFQNVPFAGLSIGMYRSSCVNKAVCNALTSTGFGCLKCCDTDLCNNHCTTTPLTSTRTLTPYPTQSRTTPSHTISTRRPAITLAVNPTTLTTSTIRKQYTAGLPKVTSTHSVNNHGTQSAASRCRKHSGYNYAAGVGVESCYKIHTNPKSWSDAAAMCKSEGASLLTIESSLKAQTADLFIKTYYSSLSFWIGLNDINDTGRFTWLSGEKLTFTDWGTGQPEHSPHGHHAQRCVLLFHVNDYHWHDALCWIPLPFICESKNNAATHHSRCHPGYTYASILGICYRIHTARKETWHDAQTICQMEQADLLHLRTIREEMFFDHKLNTYWTHHDKFWIGASDRRTEGQFYWTDGTRLSKDLLWQPREPNNFLGNEDCVNLEKLYSNNFYLNDNNCIYQSYFICEGH